MANPNSSAQRSFAAEPYDSVADVLASKQTPYPHSSQPHD